MARDEHGTRHATNGPMPHADLMASAADESGARVQGRWMSAASVLGESVGRFVRHRGDTLGAALAFQTLLALAPLLVVAVAVLAFALGEGAARAQALLAVRHALGGNGARLVESWLDTARS